MVRPETNTYFKKLLSSHENISNFKEFSDDNFLVIRVNGENINVYVDESYLVTYDKLITEIENNKNINCIVLASSWLKYSQEAKRYAVSNKIGLFTMSEFYGAIFKKDFWNYVKKERE